ncbi:MAG: MBL fold metallo-hydrolase [Euryarchaeota archaeon]|nr:MBL fold metallo-hydrolase [Euryarchaeota archaeon]
MDVETFVVPPLENNVYLVYDAATRHGVLIDTALAGTKVLPRIRELGITLTHILNTHGHADHVADNVSIAKETGAKVGIHEADAYRLEKVAKEPRWYISKPIAPSKADVVLKEGTVVEVGSIALRVLHTPGHTEGSVCFYAPEAGYLFTGDTLMRGTFGFTNGPGGSPAMIFQSLRRLYELPPETKVFPGHGRPTRVADEAWIANLRYAAPH